jgi:hypothetical protein
MTNDRGDASPDTRVQLLKLTDSITALANGIEQSLADPASDRQAIAEGAVLVLRDLARMYGGQP